MKAYIHAASKSVTVVDEGREVPELEGWSVFISRAFLRPPGYETKIGGLHTLAERVRRGPPPPPQPLGFVGPFGEDA